MSLRGSESVPENAMWVVKETWGVMTAGEFETRSTDHDVEGRGTGGCGEE